MNIRHMLFVAILTTQSLAFGLYFTLKDFQECRNLAAHLELLESIQRENPETLKLSKTVAGLLQTLLQNCIIGNESEQQLVKDQIAILQAESTNFIDILKRFETRFEAHAQQAEHDKFKASSLKGIALMMKAAN